MSGSWTARAVGPLAQVTLGFFVLSFVTDLGLLGCEFAEVELPSPLELAAAFLRVATTVVLIAWTGVATAHARRRGWNVWSPGWAATSWLIPGVSFVAPFVAIRKLVPVGPTGWLWAWGGLSGATLVLSVVVSVLELPLRNPDVLPETVTLVTSNVAVLVPVNLMLLALHELVAIHTLRATERFRLDDEAELAS